MLILPPAKPAIRTPINWTKKLGLCHKLEHPTRGRDGSAAGGQLPHKRVEPFLG